VKRKGLHNGDASYRSLKPVGDDAPLRKSFRLAGIQPRQFESTPQPEPVTNRESPCGGKSVPPDENELARDEATVGQGQSSTESGTKIISSHMETVKSTPIRDRTLFTSPRTEEVPRRKIPTSFRSISPSQTQSVSPISSDNPTAVELVLEAIPIIYDFSKHQHGIPDEVHKHILQMLKVSQDQASPLWTQWSNGSTWTRILRAGRSEAKRVSILNMLEDMGASAWYEDQITLAQASIRTKKKKPVDRKGAAIYILNRIHEENFGEPEKHIKTTMIPGGQSTSIVGEIDRQERRRISTQLSRGKKLRTVLVKRLGLGILFSSQIW
jgi:hypothetical protein